MLHRYVVQCVLPINLFNEKIFIFIWFWFAMLCILTVTSALKWVWNLAFWPAQVKIAYFVTQIYLIFKKKDKIINLPTASVKN